ncbi:peptide transporter [Thermococcus sp.]
MVKTRVKEKKKKADSQKRFELSKLYLYFREYGIPLLVLLLAYVGYKIRAITSEYKTFLDPDTFFHYEMYRRAITEWVPKYYAYAEPPMGIKPTGYLGLYTMQALFYKIAHALTGLSEFDAFKVWSPFVGAMMVIATYLVGKKLHSSWAGFWGAALMMGFYGAITKTYSGNNRGEGPFVMFFLFTVYSLLLYLDEKRWNWKKVTGLAFFIILSPIYMGVWNGSSLGVMILLATGVIVPILFFLVGKRDMLKRFALEYYPAFGASLIAGIILGRSGFVGIKNFLTFSVEVLVASTLLVLLMLYGDKFFDVSKWTYRLGMVLGSGVIGFLAFYAYLGKALFKFLKAATRSTPLYQTVAELQGVSWKDIVHTLSLKPGTSTGDGAIFVLSLLGLTVLGWRFYIEVKEGRYETYKHFIPLFHYLGTLYLFKQAVRFSFQASVAAIILAAIALGEAFVYVERMKDTPTIKTLYAVALLLLLLPMPYVAASYSHTNQIAMMRAYKTINPKMPGSVPEAWSDALLWLRNNSNPYSTVLSWWDYGYWEESSLLSQRRAVSDGGHGYDRRYIIAKFFSHEGNNGEVDLEAWGDDYVITFLDPFDRQSDFGKFNAIAYLGGAITHGEGYGMFGYVPYGNIVIQNNKTVYIKIGNNQYIKPKMMIDLIRNRVIKNEGQTAPYVLYIYPYIATGNQFYPVGILAYEKIAFCNYVKLAFGKSFAPGDVDTEKLFANFKLVYTGYNGYIKRQGIFDPSVRVYKFTPFGVYRIDALVNGTWKEVYNSISGGKLRVKIGNETVALRGQQKLRIYISAFGRDVKNGKLIFEAYNGTKLVKKEVIADDLNIDHLAEKPVEVEVTIPPAQKYRLVLIQEGPVGVTNGPVYVNGKIANPSMPLTPGESGTIKLTEAFEKDYKDVKFTLRGVVYYYVAPNGVDIYRPNFYLEPHMDVIGYIPIKELSVKAGNNVISGKVSVPKDFFESYVESLKKKYGNKVVIVRKRLEPIFLTQKEYVIWEGS